MSQSHTRSVTEGDITSLLPSPSHGYVGGQIAAIFSPTRQEEIAQHRTGVSTPQARTRKEIVFKPFFKERDECGKLIRDTSKGSLSPTKVDTQEDQGLFTLTQKKSFTRSGNIKTFEGPQHLTTDRTKSHMQQFLDTDLPETQTARESVRKNENLTNLATKSYDNRKSEPSHSRLSTYLSTGNLLTTTSSNIKTDVFLMKGLPPQKNALFASKAMRESVELAKVAQERKSVTRYSHAFSSVGRDRVSPQFVGSYEVTKPAVGLYSTNVDATRPNRPSAIIPKIKFSSSKTPQPIYNDNEKYENYFPKIHQDKRTFQKKERELNKLKGIPKSTQKAVKDLRSLWQMDFDYQFYKDLRKNYGEKISIPEQIKLKPSMQAFDERKLKLKQRDIFEKNHIEYELNSKTGRFKPKPLKTGLFASPFVNQQQQIVTQSTH